MLAGEVQNKLPQNFSNDPPRAGPRRSHVVVGGGERASIKKPQVPAVRQPSSLFLRMMKNVTDGMQQNSPALQTPVITVSSTRGNEGVGKAVTASVPTNGTTVPADAGAVALDRMRKRLAEPAKSRQSTGSPTAQSWHGGSVASAFDLDLAAKF